MARQARRMRVLAIDPATRSGWTIGEPGQTPRLGFVDFRTDELDDAADVFARAMTWLIRLLAREQPELVVLEDLVPRFDKTIQSGLWAIFSGICRAKGIRVMAAPIATWRRYTLGDGRLPGKVAKARAVELCQQLGWPAPNHDAAEAACIWLWACSRVAPRIARRPEPLFVVGRRR